MKAKNIITAIAFLSVAVSGCRTTGEKFVGNHRDVALPDRLHRTDRQHVRVVLQVDGGGIMGITPAIVLAELERQLNQKPYRPNGRLGEHLDMCLGASTGAIISGMLASGVSAQTVKDFYTGANEGQGLWLFRTQAKPFSLSGLVRHKYYRGEFERALQNALKNESWSKNCSITMGELSNPKANQGHKNPVLVIPAFELRSGNTVFIRSLDANGHQLPLSKNLPVAEVVGWSGFSAASYFGPIFWDSAENFPVKLQDASGATYGYDKGAVFQDGGQGTQNNTIGAALVEMLNRDWNEKKDGQSQKDEVILISMGTGNDTRVRSHEKMTHMSVLKEVMEYSFVADNQARNESIKIQVAAGRSVAEYNKDWLHFYRFDYEDDSGRGLDSAKDSDVDAYKAAANHIIESDQFKQLVAELQSISDQPKAPVGTGRTKSIPSLYKIEVLPKSAQLGGNR